MSLVYRSIRKFCLDFSKLSSAMTTEGGKNFKINGQKPIDGYMTPNTSAPHAVIMLHEWWGFNKSMVKTADIFSNDIFKVFVPDLYRGKPAIDAQDADHKMSHLDWAGALQDIKMIKDHLHSSSKSVSIMGFCMGGALTFASLSSIQGWKSGVSFYGVPDLNAFKLENIKAPLLAHFGELDPLKGFSDIETAHKLNEEVKKNNYKYPVMVNVWKGLNHAFCNQDFNYFDQQARDQAFHMTRVFMNL